MSIESELRALRTEDGRWVPDDVVTWARDNPDSELHKEKRFMWDDDAAAAHQHRLTVARTLIRVHIRSEEGDRATISLVQDRRTGGGYRELGPVLSNAEMRSMALRQALREFRAWERRYNHLRELAAVFAAGNAIEEQQEAA